ncbi:MAG: hypothetical protein VX593_10225 [Pseudomonadota bacterium]|nr:hypothetical protein [Pseudomonadota bacterium]
MAHRFSFDNAVLHFARSDGPRGFVWKYLLAYLMGAICLTALGYTLFQPLFSIWFDILIEAMSGTSEAEIEAILARRTVEIVGWIVFGTLLMLGLGVLFWAVFEASVQRRLVRDEGFRIKVGADEMRLILVGLIWLGISIAAQILSLLFVSASTASIVYALDNPAGGAIAVFASMFLVAGFWIWLTVRLSPASAMTIRDRKFVFFDAWNVTKGRFWTLFLSYLVLNITISVLWFIAYAGIGSGIAAAFMANVTRFETAIESGNPLAVVSAFLQIDILAPIIGGWMFWVVLQGLFFLMWAGPASLAAKTDPRGGGTAQAPDVFA